MLMPTMHVLNEYNGPANRAIGFVYAYALSIFRFENKTLSVRTTENNGDVKQKNKAILLQLNILPSLDFNVPI